MSYTSFDTISLCPRRKWRVIHHSIQYNYASQEMTSLYIIRSNITMPAHQINITKTGLDSNYYIMRTPQMHNIIVCLRHFALKLRHVCHWIASPNVLLHFNFPLVNSDSSKRSLPSLCREVWTFLIKTEICTYNLIVIFNKELTYDFRLLILLPLWYRRLDDNKNSTYIPQSIYSISR